MPHITDPARTRISGTEPGERMLNGIQTAGRALHDLSRPVHETVRVRDVEIEVRDGARLRADVRRPTGEGRFPALVAFSCYPRQLQDVGAPLGFIEAGVVDYFAPRGYAHLIVNARGTAGSEGEWTMLDSTERDDLFDVIEWAAAQPWCDGNVGMIGISYFAMAQIAAAVTRPPHLKAIFPLATTTDMYEAVWHHGLANSGFISAWLPAVGVLSQKPAALWEGHRVNAAREVLSIPAVHKRMGDLNGEVAVRVLRSVVHTRCPEEPFGRLWREATIEHPLHDEFWDDRDSTPGLADVDIPVYLGCEWDNVPLHLPSTFRAWDALRHNPNVRMALLPAGGLSWPWESLHEEALGWYDYWLKGVDTGILDGPAVRYTVPGEREDGTDGADDWRCDEAWPPRSEPLTLHLRADGTLARQADDGSRRYLHGAQNSRMDVLGGLSDRLEWVSAPLAEPMEFAGEIELVLDAVASGEDTAWIAVLFDIDSDGVRTPITAGWMRSSHRDGDRSVRPVPPGTQAAYRIPVVANARHLGRGHSLALVVTSSDERKDAPTVLGFRHAPVGGPSVNTILSSSRLTLPVLPATAAGR